MSKNLVPTQSQAQAQSFMYLTEPQEETDLPGEVISKPRRSTSVKHSRYLGHSDQVQPIAKRAKYATITSQRSLSPRRDYPKGLVLSLGQERLASLVLLLRLVLLLSLPQSVLSMLRMCRPVQAQDRQISRLT